MSPKVERNGTLPMENIKQENIMKTRMVEMNQMICVESTLTVVANNNQLTISTVFQEKMIAAL